jgi:hypothetical protein
MLLRVWFVPFVFAGLLLAAPAQAKPKVSVSGLTLGLNVALDVEGTPLAVNANVNIQSFTLSGGQLFASGSITGSATLNGVTKPLNATFSTVALVDADCTATTANLSVTLQSLSLNVNGIPLSLGSLTLTASGTPGTLLGDLICSLADVLDGGGSSTALVTLLNQILRAGAVPTSVSVAGTLDLATFSLQNGVLTAAGSLVGTVTLNGLTVPLNTTFNVQALVNATYTATSASLTVVLQQLNLNLNGLALSVGQTTVAVTVDATSPVYLLITDIADLLSAGTVDEAALLLLLDDLFAIL